MELISTAEAARILGVALNTVANRTKEGKLTAFCQEGTPWQKGRWLRFSMEEVLALRTAEPTVESYQESEGWMTGAKAAALLGIDPDSFSRLAKSGIVRGRRAKIPGRPGPPLWVVSTADIEAYRKLTANTPAALSLSDDWIPISEARRILGLSKPGVIARVRSGILDSCLLGTKGNERLYLSAAQCRKQVETPVSFPRAKPLRQINASVVDLAWFAGFFDGEGCVTIGRPIPSGRAWVLSIHLSNSGMEAIRYACDVIGGGVYDRPRQKPHYRDQLHWYTSCDDALAILLAIRPYLKVKHLQADLAIEFQQRLRADHWGAHRPMPESEKEWREAQRKKISLLNRPNVICAIP